MGAEATVGSRSSHDERLGALEDEVAALRAALQAVDDERAVHAVMVAYHRACDATEGKGRRVATLFTEDARWESVGPRADPAWAAVGRAALATKFDRNHERMPFAQHHLTGGQVTLDGDVARGWWGYFQSCTYRGEQALWIGGEYDVDLARVDGAWLISHLRVHNHFTTPFDRGWVEVPHLDTP